MTWITTTRGAYHGHFIDGYFRDETHVNRILTARRKPLPRAKLVFVALSRFRRSGDGEYQAISSEFARDVDPGHYAWTLVAHETQSDPQRFIEQFVSHADFDIKDEADYADYCGFQRDVSIMLGRVVSLFAMPVDLGASVLHYAGFDNVAVMARGEHTL